MVVVTLPPKSAIRNAILVKSKQPKNQETPTGQIKLAGVLGLKGLLGTGELFYA